MTTKPNELADVADASLVDMAHLCSVDMETWDKHSNLVLGAIAALRSSVPSEEELARLLALAGVTVDRVRNPPNDLWAEEEWRRRVLQCIPTREEQHCRETARAVLALFDRASLSPTVVDDSAEAPVGSKMPVYDRGLISLMASELGVEDRPTVVLRAALERAKEAAESARETAPDPVAADGFGCEADDGGFTIFWPDGRAVSCNRTGKVTFMHSPWQAGRGPASTTHAQMFASPDPVAADGIVERLRRMLGGVYCDALGGDNLAIFLASEFEPGVESEEMDDGGTWKQEALDLTDRVLDAIHAHYAPLIERLQSDLTRAEARGRRAGLEEAAGVAEDHSCFSAPHIPARIAAAIRSLAEKNNG